MTDYGDLEILLRRQGDDAGDHQYQVELRYQPAGSEAESVPGSGPATLDPDALALEAPPVEDADAYGRLLTQQLFAGGGLRAGFIEALSRAEEAGSALRLRLVLSGAEELHRLRWELLRRPDKDTPLSADAAIVLSRYLVTADPLPVHTRPKSQLRALVMVANPTGLNPAQLAPIDAPAEIAVARENLQPISTQVVAEPASGKRATLDNLLDSLNQGKFDILYLVCHGRILDGDSQLYFENEAGAVELVAGSTLQAEFERLRDNRPNLVILASCESAGDGEGRALAALGPRLAEAGVPAVIAMQDVVSIETNRLFMAAFFKEIYRHGVIDRAVSVARWETREAHDYWVPVLFMRLKNGRIWTGFSEKASADLWPVLSQAVRNKQVVPILGTGLVEPIIGSLRDISAHWAEIYDYPIFDHDRDSVAQIAQFMAVKYGLAFTKTTLEETLVEKLRSERRDDLAGLRAGATLDETINLLAAKRRQRTPEDAYRVLAGLPLKYFVTSNLSGVLESALVEAGKTPRTLISPWNEHVRSCYFGQDPDDPSCTGEMLYDFDFNTIDEHNPLVFHPFGRLSDPDSVVLTEDEYFQYLTGLQQHDNLDLLVKKLPHGIFSGTLLFLGFHLIDWEFRVLLQTLFAFESSKLFRRKKHIAVIQLDQAGIKDIQGARDYLEQRLQESWDIRMYVGSPEDFIAELQFFAPNQLAGPQ